MTVVWDVFPYWREHWAIHARLHLWEALRESGLDYRPVALVGDRTFRGDPLPPADPPVHVHRVVLDADGAWEREKQQRDSVSLLRDAMADDDLVLLCDADELIDPQALDAITTATAAGPVKLRMAHYACGTRWRNPTPWRHAAACRARDLPEHVTDQLRDVRTLPQVDNAGWHLTYFGSNDDNDRKLKSFSHVEVDTPQMRADLVAARERGFPGWLDDPLTGQIADILAHFEEEPACR